MKIPTSTSFVMAATASLALQSSARAIPPDSPDLGHVPPHSGRAESSARFSGGFEESHEASAGRRFKLRDTEVTDSASKESVSGAVANLPELTESALDDTLGELSALGIVPRTTDKNARNSAADSSAPSLSARQLPVSGVPGAASNIPGQAENGIIQQGANVTSTVVGTVGSAIPQGLPLPSLPAAASALPDSPPIAPAIPVNSSQLPVASAGVMRRDDAFPPGVPQVSQLPGAIVGIPGQVIGSTPVGGIVGNSPVNPNSTGQGIAGAVPGIPSEVTNNVPISQVSVLANSVPSVTPLGQIPQNAADNLGALQRKQFDPDSDGDDADEIVAPPSPSSTIAAPSSSPNSSPSASPAVASSADAFATSMSSAASATPVPADKVDLPVSPSVALPVNPPNILPTPSGQSAVLPLTSDLPVSVPVPLPTGGSGNLPVNQSDVPVSLPVNVLPSNLPIPKKRALTRRDDPSGAESYPSGFPTPSGPIPSDTPPLLEARGITMECIGVGVSASANHSASATSTVPSGTSVPPVSGSNSTATTKASGPATSQPSRRRRFFRFGRDEIA